MSKNKSFQPILAPNQQPDLNELKYPMLISEKMDGVRAVFYKGEILSRSLKPIPNKQLKEKLDPIRKFTEEQNIVLDGEIFSPLLKFQDIISLTMTDDFEDKKTIKKNNGVLSIPEHLKFYCFDSIQEDNCDQPFKDRLEFSKFVIMRFSDIAFPVEHIMVFSKEETEETYLEWTERGLEGAILRDPYGRYKCGRGTLKEGILFKLKPFITFDAKIIDVIQATEVNDTAEKTINEKGYSVTSKKQGDRHLVDSASNFLVDYEGMDLKVSLSSMTDLGRKGVWRRKEEYIGKWIEFKGMMVGAKSDGLPRHPVMLRFREDKGA